MSFLASVVGFLANTPVNMSLGQLIELCSLPLAKVFRFLMEQTTKGSQAGSIPGVVSPPSGMRPYIASL